MKLLYFFIAALLTAPAAAQDYSIPWSTSDAGGGASSGGSYSLHGTIAQTDAADTSAGAQFSMSAGFWSISVFAEPGPLYSAYEPPHEGEGETLLYLWWFLPQPPGTVLERSTDLENWEVIRLADEETQHIVPSAETRGYFRLRTPE